MTLLSFLKRHDEAVAAADRAMALLQGHSRILPFAVHTPPVPDCAGGRRSRTWRWSCRVSAPVVVTASGAAQTTEETAKAFNVVSGRDSAVGGAADQVILSGNRFREPPL